LARSLAFSTTYHFAETHSPPPPPVSNHEFHRVQASTISAKYAGLEASYSVLRQRHEAVDSDLVSLRTAHSQLARAHEAQTLELAEVGERLSEEVLRHTEAQASLKDLRAGATALELQLKQVRIPPPPPFIIPSLPVSLSMSRAALSGGQKFGIGHIVYHAGIGVLV